MLTFYRRIRKALIGGGTVSRYTLYAFGEIALVVIGILIALQINNWNEYQKNRIIEREILQDILTNLEDNNEIIRATLNKIEEFDQSTDIILSAIENKTPYNDDMAGHFFSCNRTGGLMFPLGSAGYESFKNQGFNIVRSKVIKDRVLQLFEVSIDRIKTKAQWTMDGGHAADMYTQSLFRQIPGQQIIPVDYDQLLEDYQYQSIILNIKESRRGFLKEDVVRHLRDSEELIQLIEEELTQSTNQ